MAEEIKRHAHRLYLNPQLGWVTQPEGAVLRMDAQVRAQVSAQARNQIYQDDKQGGWVAVTDDKDLSPVQRGLVWFGWQTVARGVPYLAFKGVRVMDQAVAEQLLNGLSLRDEDGIVIENPEAAGHIFLLSVDDARVFHQRIKDAGGQVHRGDPLPAGADEALKHLDQIADTMDTLGSEDEAALNEARGDDFSGQPLFERRHETIAEAMKRARSHYEEGKRALRPLLIPGRSLAENSQAQSLLHQLDFAVERCQLLLEQREAAEREFAEILARASGNMEEPEPSAAQLLMFREMGRLASEQGWDVEYNENGVRIHTPKGWMMLDGLGMNFE